MPSMLMPPNQQPAGASAPILPDDTQAQPGMMPGQGNAQAGEEPQGYSPLGALQGPASPEGLAMNGGLGFGGMNEGMALFEKFLLQFAETWNPLSKWLFHPVHVSEDDGPGEDGMQQDREPYGGFLHAPPDFDYNQHFPMVSGSQASPETQETLQGITKSIIDLYPGIEDLTPPFVHRGQIVRAGQTLRKKQSEHRELPPGGRWITVHPHHDPEEPGHPIYIVPNPDGSHTVVAGAGGKLNGLRMTGVKSPEEYRKWANTRRQEKAYAKQQAEKQRIEQVGMSQYVQEQAQKKAALEEANAAKVATDRDYVKSVLEARGHDTSIMDIPREAMAGLTPEQQKRMATEHHKALVSYADAVAHGVEQKLVAGYSDVIAGDSGDITAGAVLGDLAATRGKGYQAQIEALAQERGITSEGAQDAARDVSWRRLLENAGGDADAAKEAGVNQEKRQEAAKKAKESTKAAAERLGEAGVGPEAVKSLSEEPDDDSMENAAAILLARKKSQDARKRLKSLQRDIDGSDDVTKLPSGMAVVATPMSDAEAMKHVAQSLSEQAMTHAMNDLVNTTNDLGGHGELRRHYSVGSNAAFNEIMAAALPGAGFIDPLTADILGTSVIAHAIARRVQAGGEGDASAVAEALEGTHLATQEAIARKGVEKAQEYLAAAGEIEDTPIADHPEGLAGALVDMERKESLLHQAQASAGEARGRVEAMAATIAAFKGIGRSKEGGVLASLGQISAEDAVKNLAAAGLTQGSRFDEDGNLLQQGQYTLHHDGTNASVEVHPDGLDALVKDPDPDMQERTLRSQAIKAGREDDPTFHPAGITTRPKTDFDFNPALYVQTGHVLRLSPSMAGEDMTRAVAEHIGARIQEGQDPFDVLASVSSASFVAGLGIDSTTEKSYRDTLHALAPPVQFPPNLTPREKSQVANEHREYLRERLTGMADAYTEAAAARGEISSEQAALDKQHISATPQTRDIVYQAILADPRTQYAFHKVGDLGRDGKAAIRSYAFEHLFGFDPKTEGDDILSPLSPDEHEGFTAWQDLKQAGNPYRKIQEMWEEHASQDAGLFGEPDVPPLATIDLGNDAAILQLARENPRMLGYQPPCLEVQPEHADDASIVSDARRRIKKTLRKQFFTLSGMDTLASTGFNPEKVVTGSGRWGDYVDAMGGGTSGEVKAIATVQEFMRGDVSQRFAAAHRQITGRELFVADRTLAHADRHAQAMLPPELREDEDAMSKRVQASIQRGRGGKFERGEVRDLRDASLAQQDTQLQLIDKQETDRGGVRTSRASLGKSIEGTLKQLAPSIDLSRPVEAAQDVSFSDADGVKIQRAIKLIESNKRQGLNLGAGSGKAQPLDARVLTPDGWRRMGDLSVGDKVISVDGSATEVMGVFPQGEKEIFRVVFSDGASTECCEDHLWLTQTSYERGKLVEAIQRKDAQKYPGARYDLTPYLPKVRSLAEIRHTLVARGRKNHSIPVVAPVQLNEQFIPLHPYLLGLLLGDGGLTGAQPVLTTSDEEIAIAAQELLPESCSLRHKDKYDYVINGAMSQYIPTTAKAGYPSITRRDVNPVKFALKELGLWGKGSSDKFIPDIYLINSESVRLSVLQGLLDSDGTVGRDGTGTIFYSVSKNLVEGVVFLVRSLGGIAKITTKTPSYTHNGERRRGKLCYVVTIVMPPHINPFRLSRKASAVRPKSKYTPARYVVEVVSVGLKQAQCISVAHSSRLYVTDDFIVTHNTLALIGAFTDLKAQGKVNRHLILAPSSAVDQIGAEHYKFVDPGAGLTWFADGGASPEDRKAALADKDRHIVVMTPESLREDVTNAVAQDKGIHPAEAVSWLEGASDAERDKAIHGAMRSRGWNFDMSTYDEGHRLRGRKGKPDAHMARVGDSVARMTPYHVDSTADPIKNDPSEAASMLATLDPKRYAGKRAQQEFIRRYGRNIRASAAALQREVSPYIYAEHTRLDVDGDTVTHMVPLSDEQRARYDQINTAYRAARKAKARGEVDIEALKAISPNRFTGDPAEDVETAQRLTRALGAVRDSALESCVHDADGAKGDRAIDLAMHHLKQGDHVTIFANRLATVHKLSERLLMHGVRVAKLTGDMPSSEKTKARLAFSPPKGTEPTADVLVLSDAGAVALNLQRGNVQIQMDTPDTAMLYEQRKARNLRRGQKRDVMVHDLVADAPVDHKARKRLADKADLREIMTSPAEAIDDSGLMLNLEKARQRQAEKLGRM